MRLCKFEIHNFKGIKDASLDWEDISVLIGENNAGKSSVLRALEVFLSGQQIKDTRLFHNYETDSEHAIALIGHFDQLTPQETTAIAVSGRTHDGVWTLKKEFWTDAASEDDKSAWQEQYYSYSSEESFSQWPDNDRSWNNFPDDYKDLIDAIPSRKARVDSEGREVLRALVRSGKPQLVQRLAPSWVKNPGGGGNWKSNANSVVPRLINVRAVHEATDETDAKEKSTYGKIVSLIVERKMLNRIEVVELKSKVEEVLALFRPNRDHPETQAPEIRDIQEKINKGLELITGGVAEITTAEPDIKPLLLPSTTLELRECAGGLPTTVNNQGNALQRALILTLLQVLAEIEDEPQAAQANEPAAPSRAVVVAVEEPELYMHPHMARKMRDALYGIAAKNGFQVICTTHSPVFLDMAVRHRSIIRVVKDSLRHVSVVQPKGELFGGAGQVDAKKRLRMLAEFNPAVNEVFFARRVTLLEEQTAEWAIRRAADCVGIFTRFPHLRYDVTLVDCGGKASIPLFQQVLNHFGIPYAVIHDEDSSKPEQVKTNQVIGSLLGTNKRYMFSPDDLETTLGYQPQGKNKPFRAMTKVEELARNGALPEAFAKSVYLAYFGQETEPALPAA